MANGHERTRNPNKGRKTKAALLVGSLNLNGRGNIANGISKWGAVNQLLREKRIGLLAVQETHLDEEDESTVRNLYGRRIHLVNSPDSNNPTARRGVAIILNRELVDTSNVRSTVIVPGRAMIVTTNWHASRTITALNVYAPNGAPENAAFWTTLEQEFSKGKLHMPDIMVGDLNLVEEAVDRIPMKESSEAALTALRSLTTRLGLHDGWRLTNPTEKAYTYPQRGGTHRSRLDRIYATDDLLRRSVNWDITTTGAPTDHCLVTARLTAAQSPHIGKGRWTMPPQLLLDHNFLKQVTKMGEDELARAEACASGEMRTERMNPQLVLSKFKQRVRELAKARMKKQIPKLSREIARLTSQRNAIQSQPTFAGDEAAQEEASIVQERILELETKRHNGAQIATTTHYNLNAERISKYWTFVA
ncbi:hypothetical protein FOMPIDRAFT_1030516 [Fomitopsis schrenkii]|uniref:Endonuclease/exonuclease/phosphatase domain-containing protein n=1 Tax=Fomitopsis schrenkii TaxID=2126942 RepID=S8EAD5_FOMSC|nr:hypothetical protein FOMPIDRAFT_1030516 [Fomitopsis schrenkii]